MDHLKKFIFRLFLVASLATHVGCSDVTDKEHISQAQDLIDGGDLRSAAIELKNALRKNPENAQARWLMAKVHLDLGDALSAEKELRKAQALGIVEDSTLHLLARALLAQDKYEEVLGLAPHQGLSPAVRAEVLATQGTALLSQAKTEQALRRFEEALAIYPTSLPANVAKARWLVENDVASGRKLLESTLKLDATYAPAWSLLGDVERGAQRLEKAEEAYSKAIKYRQDNSSDILRRVEVRILLQQFDKAQRDLDHLLKRAPKHARTNYLQGRLFFIQRRFRDAREPLEIALKLDPQNISVYFYLGATHFLLGNHQQAEELISRFIALRPNYIPGRKLLATIRLQEGKYAEVEKLISPVVVERGEDVVALNLLASALLKQGRSDEGIRLLEKVVELRPGSAEARTELGSVLVQTGDPAAAQHLESALAVNPELREAGILLVLAHLRDKQLDKAMEAARSYQQNNPQSATPYNMVGMVYLAKKQPQEAKKAFHKALELSPGDVSSNYNLAQIAKKDNSLDEARGFYEAVLEHHPNHLTTLIRLASLDAREKNNKAMVSKLKQAASAHPDALQPRIMLARYYLSQGKPDQVHTLFFDAEREYPDHPQVLALIGESQLAMNAVDDARLTLERLVERWPQSAQAHFLLSQTHARSGNRQLLETELRQVLKLNPRHVQARVALARLQLSDNKTDQAQNNLELLKEEAPGNPRVMLLEADLLSHRGNQKQALVSYEELFKRAANTNTMLALTQQRWKMGDKEGALAVQRNWVDTHPQDVKARLVLANNYLIRGRTEDAIEQYAEVLKYSEDNLIALNNLAWHMRKTHPAKALAYAEQAFAVAPDSARILDTLAVVLIYNGQAGRGLRMSDRAASKSPNNPTILYHKAIALEAMGRLTEATAILSQILEQPNAFPERFEAEKMLARLQLE